MKMLSRRKSRTVVDTHVPDVVPRRYVSNVIVLRCHPRILQRRLRKKGWKPSKVRENVLAEILDSCYGLAIDYYGAKKVAQVDTSRIDADKSASRANRILKKRISSKPSVDWITRLSQEHRLEEFLR
jgi:adenylate kinase